MPIYKVVPTTAFDVLDETSSVWHGKQYYFLQDDGSVYSRESCRNMTLEEAIEEFCNTLSDFVEGLRRLKSTVMTSVIRYGGMKMASDLKPCPFCGSDAVMKIEKHIPAGYDYTPTCTVKSCAGRITKKWLKKDDAVNAWNRRADDGK